MHVDARCPETWSHYRHVHYARLLPRAGKDEGRVPDVDPFSKTLIDLSFSSFFSSFFWFLSVLFSSLFLICRCTLRSIQHWVSLLVALVSTLASPSIFALFIIMGFIYLGMCTSYLDKKSTCAESRQSTAKDDQQPFYINQHHPTTT